MSQVKIPVDLILSKMADNAEKVQSRAHKASEVLLGELDTDLAKTPYDVVYREDRVQLKHYRPRTKIRYRTPLLVVYALINRETMLDLQPGRSVVERFLDAGIDLYMIDWGYPTRKDRFLGFDEHINGYMDDIVDLIRERNETDKINLMGICMGGTFSVIYSALHPEKIKNLVTTVTPTNFDTKKGLLHVWMEHIDVDRVVDTFGNLPADMMNFGFLLLNPARLMIDKYVGFMENIDNKQFVENFVRMDKWIFDSPDLPGEVFRQFVKDCYQGNKLLKNQLEVGGQRVDLNRLTMPLLNIYGKYDHLVPPEACEKLIDHVGSKDTENLCLNTGHIGIYVSSKYQEAFAPKIASWLKARDGMPERKPRSIKTAATSSAAVVQPISSKKKASGKRSRNTTEEDAFQVEPASDAKAMGNAR
ncbi:class III poly(R)-hydroxyalkanoic acid synthase subunit PhaC [Desulfosarcina ovata]|uniref:Poly(3-hydroxyalkanoate) polymerase subunit PhaC n=2 Tax=Desulfosarcina ovata TaxID=83564 RepID=A0A5K8AHA2_9BACT|nr:class III poly(R)-hydroxyalkanoic acid synthase subunit PhaC [Desulfosarcina ovata]BBO82510.1 poly-beta-hydroxybutyrate polymerase [Desulfosarcina ovata subsp. sediminis]BBO92011.1 poly-beta-hydroxybutyrate polymerase [Desulfosarcina ovata subsp. ovata]